MDASVDCTIKDYQIGAMFCLAYVGDNADALAMEHILVTAHLQQSECFERERFRTSMTALALMARREISEATRIMAEIVRPEFWKGNEVKVFQFDGLDPLEEDLVLSAYATAIVNGGPDPELAARIIKVATHKEAVANFLQAPLVEKERLKIIDAEQQPVSDQMRALLQNHYRILYLPLVHGQGDK
ncbi:MAG: hypothetical protein WKF77_29320 [Planctomycetaceae bacterium]